MVNVQVRDGMGWRTVLTRDESEMDFPVPVKAKEIGVRVGEVCRLALVVDGRVLRKRMLIAVS